VKKRPKIKSCSNGVVCRTYVLTELKSCHLTEVFLVTAGHHDAWSSSLTVYLGQLQVTFIITACRRRCDSTHASLRTACGLVHRPDDVSVSQSTASNHWTERLSAFRAVCIV